MNRENLEALSINKLRALASKLNLNTSGARSKIFERVAYYYDRVGWPQSSNMWDQASGAEEDSGAEVQDPQDAGVVRNPPGSEIERLETRGAPLSERSESSHGGPAAGTSGVSNAHFGINIQDIVSAVVQVLEERQRGASGSTRAVPLQGNHGREVEVRQAQIVMQVQIIGSK
ncbi:hypothetical protein ACS0PU_010464 [Formica fusca]